MANPQLLQRATPKQIAMRMLQNLQGVYVRTHDFDRAVTVLDLLLLGAPEIADELWRPTFDTLPAKIVFGALTVLPRPLSAPVRSLAIRAAAGSSGASNLAV